jgi:hypothetical protein
MGYNGAQLNLQIVSNRFEMLFGLKMPALRIRLQEIK